ncbi:MAG: hypothetical protein IKB73_03885 [Ruminococcus sp.]|nr:hypothetical protein [Ruminococcus sp.]
MNFTKRIFALFLVVILCVTLVGCNEKTAVTAEQFTEIMESNDFSVVDSTLFAQTVVSSDTVLTALSDEYELDYYKLKNETSAQHLYLLNKEAFTEQMSDTDSTSETNDGNYDYFEGVTDTDFYMTSRIGDTLIYCYTDKEYKDEITTLIKALGYK